MTAHAIYYLRCRCGGSFEGWRGEQYFSAEQVREAASKKGWKYTSVDGEDFCPQCIENMHRVAKVENYIKDNQKDGSFKERIKLIEEYYK